jgi:hypothetical protein
MDRINPVLQAWRRIYPAMGRDRINPVLQAWRRIYPAMGRWTGEILCYRRGVGFILQRAGEQDKSCATGFSGILFRRNAVYATSVASS